MRGSIRTLLYNSLDRYTLATVSPVQSLIETFGKDKSFEEYNNRTTVTLSIGGRRWSHEYYNRQRLEISISCCRHQVVALLVKEWDWGKRYPWDPKNGHYYIGKFVPGWRQTKGWETKSRQIKSCVFVSDATRLLDLSNTENQFDKIT